MSEILEQFISRQNALLDHLLKESFRKRFGFPIEEVKDTENLKHIVIEGDPLESFQYRGKTFLLWQSGTADYKFTKQDNGDILVTVESRYLSV